MTIPNMVLGKEKLEVNQWSLTLVSESMVRIFVASVSENGVI